MNKYILADMVTERLTREIGMVAKSLPEEITILETILPSGRVLLEPALYQAEKIKKAVTINHTIGERRAGTVVMIVGADEYDFPFMLADIAFDVDEKDNMFAEFEVIPLIKDDESTTKYIDPFRQWFEAIDTLPSEPVTQFPLGEHIKANLSPITYLRYIPDVYINEVLNFTKQFFDIFLDIYQKAEPVKNAERRSKMNSFRSEWNKHLLEEDPSAVLIVEAFGQQTAELFINYFSNL
jgi:15,16-dihydrobiliverdin:ferredoxin oxidoreductase